MKTSLARIIRRLPANFINALAAARRRLPTDLRTVSTVCPLREKPLKRLESAPGRCHRAEAWALLRVSRSPSETLGLKALHLTYVWPLVFSGLLIVTGLPASAARVYSAAIAADPNEPPATGADASGGAEPRTVTTVDVTIEASPEGEVSRKDVPWLGVSTTEASEALVSQLDLEAGVGLVINYVAPDSPASKSGLRKHDVLVQFDDQSLVHPAQLRKLVRVRKEGDVVKVGFYRAGKRQTASVTLGKTRAEAGLFDDEQRALKGNFKELHQQLRDLHLDEAVRDQMRILRESMGNIKIDQKEVQADIRRGMEQARKAIQDALRNVTNGDAALNPVRKVLENLARSGVVVDDKADVVVRSSDKNMKSLVRTDDSGTIVLVGNPKLHLTAHDKAGKLLFDGPIEAADERAKVPRELWTRVEPLLDEMGANVEQPKSKESQ